MLYDTRYIIAEFVQHPSATGHFTVSPKNVSPDLEDASPVDIEGLLRDLPRITMALQKATGQTDFWVCLQNGPDAGQMGPHLNLQCVPCPERKKTVEIKMLGEPKIVSAESAKKLAEALRAVAGEDQLGNALGKPSQPAESSWRAPVMRRNVNPAGVSSPCIARARAPHPQLEEWAKKSGVREDERNVKVCILFVHVCMHVLPDSLPLLALCK